MRIASLVLAALLVAGCAATSVPRADRPAARSLVLRPSDLPDGWDAASHDATTDNYEQVAERFDRCLGSSAPLPTDGERASSDDFSQARGARQVKNTVILAAGGRAARSVRNLQRPGAARCLTEAFRFVLPGQRVEGLSVRSVSTERLDVTVDADEAVALRTTLGLRLRTLDFVVYVDNVFVASGPWFGRLYLVGTGEPFDGALEHRLAATVAERLAG